jgi:hypothetical protein
MSISILSFDAGGITCGLGTASFISLLQLPVPGAVAVLAVEIGLGLVSVPDPRAVATLLARRLNSRRISDLVDAGPGRRRGRLGRQPPHLVLEPNRNAFLERGLDDLLQTRPFVVDTADRTGPHTVHDERRDPDGGEKRPELRLALELGHR